MKNKIKKMVLISLSLLSFSCNESRKEETPLDLFFAERELLRLNYFIDKDHLALIEGIACFDSLLVISDYYLGNSYSLFHLQEGRFLGRFGKIGDGPDEIPLGCHGYINKKLFYVSNEMPGMVSRYNLDSLSKNIDSPPVTLSRFSIPHGFFSGITPVNDSIFLGAGIYDSKYQFVLFNSKNQVVDYSEDVLVYNVSEKSNPIYKFLTNQGILKKHPRVDKFIYSVNNSYNFDIISISNDSICLVKSNRVKSPKYKELSTGGITRAIPEEDNVAGYIDFATTEDYIYALYSEKKTNYAPGSNILLVYDWNGNPIEICKLNENVKYITVDNENNILYAAVIDEEDSGYNMIAYSLK